MRETKPANISGGKLMTLPLFCTPRPTGIVAARAAASRSGGSLGLSRRSISTSAV
jgi:hypothetical protein